MTVSNRSILNLDEVVGSLPAEEKALFQRLYAVTLAVGELRLPPSMQPWVERQFGSVEAVSRQEIVRVTNKVTSEETLFSKLRASRPMKTEGETSIEVQLGAARQNDLFNDPYGNTPEDPFGRVVGKSCTTASNVAKFDGLHGLVIFNEFNPLQFSREQVIDYIDTGREWAKRARASKPEAKYFIFIWNCLWRAGATIDHGHAHVMLTTGRHYAKIDRLRQAALSYQQEYGSDYFTDLFLVHRAVDCALERGGVRILASLTPFKNNEVILLTEEVNLSLESTIYDVLAFLRDRVGVTSFNLSLVTPPLAKTEESWGGFPVIARVVDRGNLNNRNSDMGGMEIYAANVVSRDPMELLRELREYLGLEEDYG